MSELLSRLDPLPVWIREARASLRALVPSAPRLRVRLELSFLSVAALAAFAGPTPAPSLIGILAYVALAYELPSALLARHAGLGATVKLDAGGGHLELSDATASSRLALGRALLGSVVSLLLGAGLLLLGRALSADAAELVARAGRLQALWGALHLLPFAPFKLGMLMSSKLAAGARLKHAAASLLFAVGLVVVWAKSLTAPLVTIAACGLLLASSRHLLRAWAEAADGALGAEARLAEIRALTLAGRPGQALALAEALLAEVRSPGLRSRTNHALAWAALGRADVVAAREALARLPAEAIDHHLLAAFLGSCGRTEEGASLLEEAHGYGVRSVESVKLLADFYFRLGRVEELASLAASEQSLLAATDASALARAIELLRAEPARAPEAVAGAAGKGRLGRGAVVTS